MKRLKLLIGFAALGAMLVSPYTADAKLFKRRAERRAAKRPACTTTQCTQPTGGLGVNRKGGFTGQLSDEYYANYFAKQTTPPVVPAEHSIVVQTNEPTPAPMPVQSAHDLVARAEAALEEAKAMAARAEVNQQRQAAKQAAEIKHQIATMRLEFEAKVADLESVQKALANP